MNTRVLGRGAAAMKTSAQGFGCMGMTAFYGKPMSNVAAEELLVNAFKNGITHWDTAEVYQGKNDDGSVLYNESQVAFGIKAVNNRDALQICTKYMPRLHGKTMSAEMCINACKDSCERLGVAYVDLYYVHRMHNKVSVEEQAKAMLAVKNSGLAKHIGLSEFSPKNIRKFHAICPVTCVQQEWSLINRDLEDDIAPTCRELGIGIVAYSPLSRSILSDEVAKLGKTTATAKGDKNDLRASRYPRLSAENLPKNAKLVQGVQKIASSKKLTLAQLSLAWVGSQGEDVVPIPGTTSINHLNDNAQAGRVYLTKDELHTIASSISLDKVAGARYAGGKAATYKGNL